LIEFEGRNVHRRTFDVCPVIEGRFAQTGANTMHVNRLPILIDSDAALGNIPPGQIVDALASGHLQSYVPAARLHSQLTRSSRPDAEVLVWVGSRADGGMGMKFVTVSPDNKDLAGSTANTIHSAILLCDGADAHIKCLIVGNSFTQFKTAADSALAARFLAPKRPKRLLMIGAGSQAPVHLKVMCAEYPSLERVDVWNRDISRAAQLIVRLALPIEVRVSEDLEQSAREADIISCATGATDPLLRGEWLSPGTHVDLVGGFTPQMREADDTAVLNASVYVDHRSLVMENCGDIAQPLRTGVIEASHIRGDLFDLCRKTVKGRQSRDEITLFKNGGGGHLDLMFAEWMYSSQTLSREPVDEKQK
jgi:ornithine cyclodeaminase/alanine dehydrogenase-like protein (mu-crystallin family)